MPGGESIDKRPQFDQSKNAVALRQNAVFVDRRMLREVAPFAWNYADKDKKQQTGNRSGAEQLLPPDAPGAPSALARQPNGTFWRDGQQGKLYLNIGGSLVGKSIEVTKYVKGIHLDRAADKGTLRGLGFAFYGKDGVSSFLGIPQEVASCAFVWNGDQGFGMNGSNAAPVFRNNLFACNGQVGLGLGHCWKGTLLENNTFAWNNVKRFALDWSAAGVKITYARDLIYRRNTIANNYATGFWMDVDVLRARVYDNVSRANEGFGIFFEISDGATIAYNQCYENNFAGIMVSNSTHADIWNNTLVRNGAALQLKNSHRLNGDKTPVANIPPGSYYRTADNTFGNNLLVDKPGRLSPLFSAPSGSPNQGGASASFVAASDFNAFYRLGSDPAKRPPLFAWTWGFDAAGKPINSTPASLQEFRGDPRHAARSSAYEAHSLSLDGPQTLFVRGGGEGTALDLRLAPGAPVIGKGGKQPPAVEAIAKELGRATHSPNIGAF